MIFQSLESLNDVRKFVDAHAGTWFARDTHYAFRNIVFLTGPVGAGKSFAADYISSKLKGFNKVEIVSLSDYATINSDGDVIVDCSFFKKELNSTLADFGFVCAVVEGTCNNLEDVLSTMSEVDYDSMQTVLVRPNPRMFKWNNGLKAEVLKTKKGHEALAGDALYYAKMSENRLEEEVAMLTSNYLHILVRFQKILQCSITTVVNTRIRSMHSGDGWHRILNTVRYFNWSEVAQFLRRAWAAFKSIQVLFKI